ncbi:unnamed protein product, partial [Phaeothamnion confervicola]
GLWKRARQPCIYPPFQLRFLSRTTSWFLSKTKMANLIDTIAESLFLLHSAYFEGLFGSRDALLARLLRFVRELGLVGDATSPNFLRSALAVDCDCNGEFSYEAFYSFLSAIAVSELGGRGAGAGRAMQELLHRALLPLAATLATPRQWCASPNLLFHPDVLAALRQHADTVRHMMALAGAVDERDTSDRRDYGCGGREWGWTTSSLRTRLTAGRRVSSRRLAAVLARLGLCSEALPEVAVAAVFAAASANGTMLDAGTVDGFSAGESDICVAAVAEGVVTLAIRCLCASPEPTPADAAMATSALMHRIDEGRLAGVLRAYAGGGDGGVDDGAAAA